MAPGWLVWLVPEPRRRAPATRCEAVTLAAAPPAAASPVESEGCTAPVSHRVGGRLIAAVRPERPPEFL